MRLNSIKNVKTIIFVCFIKLYYGPKRNLDIIWLDTWIRSRLKIAEQNSWNSKWHTSTAKWHGAVFMRNLLSIFQDPRSHISTEKREEAIIYFTQPSLRSSFPIHSILQQTYHLTASLDINSHKSMPILSVGMRLPSRAQCLFSLSLKSFCSTMSEVGVVGAKRFRVYEVEGEFICSEISRFLIPPLLPSAHKG